MIDRFMDEHFFLSNFYESFLLVPGLCMATSVEHAYQAMKVDGRPSFENQKEWVLSADTPGEAKKRGRRVQLREDWELVKIPVMRDLLALKFFFDTKLSIKLLATGGATLVEGNHWGDTFWGVCDGQGSNHLGKLLMERREILRGKNYVNE